MNEADFLKSIKDKGAFILLTVQGNYEGEIKIVILDGNYSKVRLDGKEKDFLINLWQEDCSLINNLSMNRVYKVKYLLKKCERRCCLV